MTDNMRFPATYCEQSEQSEQIPSDQEAGRVLAFVSRSANKANKSDGRRRWLDRVTEPPAWAVSELLVDASPNVPQPASEHLMGWSERLNRLVYEPVPGRPGSWQEMKASAVLCIWCPEPVADGDKTSCVEHRRRRDATPMPWEKAKSEESA